MNQRVAARIIIFSRILHLSLSARTFPIGSLPFSCPLGARDVDRVNAVLLHRELKPPESGVILFEDYAVSGLDAFRIDVMAGRFGDLETRTPIDFLVGTVARYTIGLPSTIWQVVITRKSGRNRINCGPQGIRHAHLLTVAAGA
jgi:hypothetical protein